MIKLPELWDIQDRRKVEQPNMTGPQLVRHSSYAAADRMEIALAAMPRDAQERYARAIYTLESLAIILEHARAGKPVLKW